MAKSENKGSMFFYYQEINQTFVKTALKNLHRTKEIWKLLLVEPSNFSFLFIVVVWKGYKIAFSFVESHLQRLLFIKNKNRFFSLSHTKAFVTCG